MSLHLTFCFFSKFKFIFANKEYFPGHTIPTKKDKDSISFISLSDKIFNSFLYLFLILKLLLLIKKNLLVKFQEGS